MSYRSRLLSGAGAVLSLLIMGAALAAWLADGTGSGQAQSTSHANSTITSASVGADLYPGATKTFTVSINNPNDYPSIVKTISAGSSNAIDSCAAGTVTSTATSESAPSTGVTGVTATVIPPQGALDYKLVSTMSTDPHQDCEGELFTLPLTATLQSKA